MPRVTIYIDNRMYGALEVIATQRGLEIRELIKEIIKKYVENYIKQCKK
jgi:metal-responsive CopG/Arc/MetJ family transcriptional regulator